MEPRKTDRRAARSRAALRKALLDLIGEKEYDAITVEELAARADLGRATFYLHYRDKDDLLLEYFTDFAASRVQEFAHVPLSILGRAVEGSALMDLESLPLRPILQVFRHAAENAPLYRITLRGGGSGRVADEIHRVVIASVNEMLRSKVRAEWGELQVKADIELLVHVFVGAFMACLNWWLEHDMPLSPEEITRQFRMMIFPGMRQALGLSPSLGA